MEILGVLILLVATGWVYSDAKERKSEHPGLWAFGVFCLMIVFLPLYLIKRPSKNNSIAKLCPFCGKYYDGAPSFCPNCGHDLKDVNI